MAVSRIDESIKSDRNKNRVVVLVSVCLLVAALGSYLIWLFLIKGFTFTVTPDRAAQNPYFEVQSGTGFMLENKLYVLGLPASVSVSAPKFASKTVNIDDSSPSTINVELSPLPATISVSTDTNRKDIQWFVNQQPQATAGQVSLSVPAGTYTISARHPAYESASISVEADIAQEIEKTIALTPVSGSLNINSQPAGASVTLNGELIGKTPLSLPQPGGNHQVTVARQGYEPVNDEITITADNKAVSRDYRLIPEQAILKVRTSPSQGLLTVDGNPVSAREIKVEANAQHTVSYSAVGFATQKQLITLKPGQESALDFTLAPVKGDVTINANLPAEVFIDGKKVGNTPFTTQLQTLEHTVEVKKPGYRTVSKSVTPSANKLTSVNAELLTEFDARRREGKPLFAQTIGIEFETLKPDTFVMGSAPNEAGRQRNEHQYPVTFTRAFWLSRHEITEAHYAHFKGSSKRSQKPVTNVSWLDAAKFTNWLSEQEGLTPFYVIKQGKLRGIDPSSTGYRLPTEAEWEYAAKKHRRAASTKYVWGSQDRLRSKQGNFADASLKGKQTFTLKDYDDGFEGKAPVGSFDAERGGLFDLDGNVREWVHDFYTLTPPDTGTPKKDYLGSSPSASHVVKGGSYKTGRLKRLRGSMRTGESDAQDDIGFRIARYLK